MPAPMAPQPPVVEALDVQLRLPGKFFDNFLFDEAALMLFGGHRVNWESVSVS
jgi:hypothetical protein